MPGILRDFIVTALAIITSTAIATIVDIVAAPVVLVANVTLRVLSGINSSAYLEPVTLAWGDPRSVSDLFTSTEITIPPILPVSVGVMYATVKTLQGAVAMVKGDTRALGQATWAILIAVGSVFGVITVINAGGSLIVPGGDYQANMQYAIPSAVVRYAPAPRMSFLTELALNALPLQTERRAFQLPTSTLYTFLALSAVTYLLSAVTALLHAIRLLLWVIPLVLGRWLVPAAFFLMGLSPILPVLPRFLQKATFWIVGIAVTSTLVFPVANVMTNGVLAALPGVSARLSVNASLRLADATASLFQPATNFNAVAFCQSLNLSPCNYNPNSPLPPSALATVFAAYYRLVSANVVMLVLQIAAIVTSQFALMQAHFVGHFLGATAMTAMGTGSLRGSVGVGWASAVEAFGSVGKMNSAMVGGMVALTDRLATPRVEVLQEHREEKEKGQKVAERAKKLGRITQLAGGVMTATGVGGGVGIALSAGGTAVTALGDKLGEVMDAKKREGILGMVESGLDAYHSLSAQWKSLQTTAPPTPSPSAPPPSPPPASPPPAGTPTP